MERFSWCLALSFVAVAVGGCAADAGSSEPAAAATIATSEALTVGSDDVFPALAPAPPADATHDQVCAVDVPQAKAAWRAWLARTGKHEGQLVWDAPLHATCKACDLENADLSLVGPITYDIEDSFMANASLGIRNGMSSPSPTFHVKNAFAFDAAVSAGVRLTAENVDLRCSTIHGDVTIQSSSGLDLSGASIANLSIASSKDVGLDHLAFGYDREPSVELQDVDGARVQTIAPVLLRGTMKGSWIFDDTQGVDLRANGALTFDHATLSFAGASGKIAIAGANVTMNGGAVVGANGSVRVSEVESGSLHVNGGAVWPVGATSLVADASITAIDLSGAKLVISKGEPWPAPNADLHGLRLAHGSLPDGADLSTAKLVDAHLERVDLRNTTISKLVDGKAVAADLSSAHLAQAKLDQLAIDGVRFVRADLRGAELGYVHGKADFSFATAGVLPPHTDDNDTDQPKVTSFEQAQLADSVFNGTQIQGTSFVRSHLADVVFGEATDATDADFGGAFFTRSSDSGVLLPNTTFGLVSRLHGARLDGADLRNVDLHGVDLRTLDAKRTSLVGAFLCGANLAEARLGGADLTNAYADVVGNVTFPDGKTGPCAPAIRTRTNTAPTSGSTTECPIGGAGHDTAGACTDDQWKVPGDPASTCTNPGTVMSGFPCQRDCECQSFQCGSDGKCT